MVAKLLENVMDVSAYLAGVKNKLGRVEPILRSMDGLESFPLNSNQCLYVHDFKKMEITYKRGITEMLGYSDADFNSDLIHAWFHPDDKMLVFNIMLAIVRFAIDHPINSGNSFILTYRVQKSDGTYIKVMRQSTVFETDTYGSLVSNLSLLTHIDFLPVSNTVYWEFRAEEFEQERFKEYVYRECKELFTNKEMTVLSHLQEGKTSKEIAALMCLSSHTVDTHRRNMLSKTGCRNTQELIRFARNSGVLA